MSPNMKENHQQHQNLHFEVALIGHARYFIVNSCEQ